MEENIAANGKNFMDVRKWLQKMKEKNENFEWMNAHSSKDFLQNAIIWMDIALMLDKEIELYIQSGQRHHWRSVSMHNISYIALGYAFELLYKCLLICTITKVPLAHDVRYLHKTLRSDIRNQIEDIIKENGMEVENFLEFMSDGLEPSVRRYSGSDPITYKKMIKKFNTVLMRGKTYYFFKEWRVHGVKDIFNQISSVANKKIEVCFCMEDIGYEIAEFKIGRKRLEELEEYIKSVMQNNEDISNEDVERACARFGYERK